MYLFYLSFDLAQQIYFEMLLSCCFLAVPFNTSCQKKKDKFNQTACLKIHNTVVSVKLKQIKKQVLKGEKIIGTVCRPSTKRLKSKCQQFSWEKDLLQRIITKTELTDYIFGGTYEFRTCFLYTYYIPNESIYCRDSWYPPSHRACIFKHLKWIPDIIWHNLRPVFPDPVSTHNMFTV